jgi:hypothetical protein
MLQKNLRLPLLLLTLIMFLWVPASADTVDTLLIDQVNPTNGYGYGLGNWNGMTSSLNTAFGAANITVSNSRLTDLDFLMGFDSLWITSPTCWRPGTLSHRNQQCGGVHCHRTARSLDWRK